MKNKTEYRKCPKCGLNYITGVQRECSVCVSESKPYRGKYCKDCGGKSGIFERCWSCHKLTQLSANERYCRTGSMAVGNYRPSDRTRTDTGMLGVRVNKVCPICGAASNLGHLCGRCYNSIVYNNDKTDDMDD